MATVHASAARPIVLGGNRGLLLLRTYACYVLVFYFISFFTKVCECESVRVFVYLIESRDVSVAWYRH